MRGDHKVMSTTAIIANWQLPLGTFIVSIIIGAITIACMVFGSEPEKGITSRRIIAVATIGPTLVILAGLGFAAPMPQVVHTGSVLTLLSPTPRPPESRIGDTICTALVVMDLIPLTFIGIVYARRAGGPAPMRAAGTVTGCVLLAVLTLLAGLGAAQALAGAGF